MSASREKKQRQSAGPDQKALKAQQEQAARKHKTIVYSVVGVLAAVLVIALLVWRTGFFQARAAAATVGDETLSAAQLSYYYYWLRNEYANSYYSSLLGFDSTVSDDKQTYMDGTTYRDYFMQAALSNAQFSFALEQEAINAGHTEAEIKDDLEANIASAKASATSSGLSYSAYLRAVYGPYMSSSVFERELTRYLMASLVYSEKYDEAFDSYAQADLEDYYKENADTLDTIEYSSLYFPIAEVATTTEDGSELPEDEVQELTDQAKADAKAKAEEALEALEGGSTFQSQIDKYELTGSYNTDHNTVVGTSYIGSAFRDQLLELDKGECDLVETDSGYYVISFHDRYLEDEPTQDVRHILARAETTTDEDGSIVAPTDEAWAAAKAKMDEIQDAWNAGDKTEDAFANLANEKSDDGDGTTGGLYERTYDGFFVPEFNDWMFGTTHQPGDVGLVQHEGDVSTASSSYTPYWGYHLIYYVGENEPVWMNTARSALATTARSEWADGIFANYATAELSGASRLGK